MAAPPPSPAAQTPTPTISQKPTRLDSLLHRQSALLETISTLTDQRNTLVHQTLNPSSTDASASATSLDPDTTRAASPSQAQITKALDTATAKTRQHIQQLQQYNEIKDIGSQLMGMIAEKKGVRIVEVQRGFGVHGED